MQASVNSFGINFRGEEIKVDVFVTASAKLYRANFTTQAPLFVTLIKGGSIWTSVPEGRQGLAEEVDNTNLAVKYVR